jgi:hypothetical protein
MFLFEEQILKLGELKVCQSAFTKLGPGPTGYTGYTGIDGIPGGPTGYTGYTGGDSEVTGPTGYTGANSTVTGYTGYTGTDGTPGGPTGYTGYTGTASTVTGYTGYTGPPGSGDGGGGGTGYTGYTGLSYIWRGTWNSGTVYVVRDCVGRNGSGYVCIQNNTNKDPATQTAYWDLSVQRGETGYTGAASNVTGPTGYTGPTGSGGGSSIGEASFCVGDTLESVGDQAPWVHMPFAGTVISAWASIKTVSSSGSVTVNIEKCTNPAVGSTWSASILNTPITIIAGARISNAPTSTTTFVEGDIFRINITGVGTGAAGLTVAMKISKT